MSSLPEEIYHEILLRLPVKSLLACKCVCKNWYALITSSDYVKLHLHLTVHRNNPTVILKEIYSGSFYSIGYDSLTSSVSEIEDDAITIAMDSPFRSLDGNARLLGECNGLICIRLVGFRGRYDFFCLWNPATSEFKGIPLPVEYKEIDVRMHAFGYDQKTDDYKLAIGAQPQGSMESSLVKVYTLSSFSWKAGKTIPYRFFRDEESGLLVNGNFHWLTIGQCKTCLLSLDIGDETFIELKLPEKSLQKYEDAHMILGVLEGRLSMLSSSYVNGVRIHFEVWEMLEYGIQESWTRCYVIANESIFQSSTFRLMWSFEKGKILFLNSGSLILYDTEHRTARKLNIDLWLLERVELSYFESLVSLKSGTYVGEESRIE